MRTHTAGSATGAGIDVRILHVPACHNLAFLRERVEEGLASLGLVATIDEVEGPYPSPTLLINGVDVIPRPAGVEGPSCRLDLPTGPQILDALRREIECAKGEPLAALTQQRERQ